MKGIAAMFFVTGVVCVTAGMIWGMIMGATEDFTFAPAHAHLNLVGFVTFALVGVYYHLVPAAAATRLARVHYGVALVGLVLMVPGIVLTLQGATHAVVSVGSVITFAAMMIFLYTVVRNAKRAKSA
jgi:hypothetical protein